MQRQSLIALKVLINKFHRGPTEAFLKNMPQEEAKNVLSQDVFAQDLSPLTGNSKDVLEKIHYSWMPALIQQFPANLQEYVLDSLSVEKGKELRSLMHKPSASKIKIAASIKSYLLQQLYHKLNANNILPVPFLPTSSLNILATCKKSELVKIVDFLGLQDLAEAVRFIVDKKKLKEIYTSLPEKKQKYLKICLHQKDKLPVPKLELDHWDGNYERLEILLHRRGMVRLAKALSGQHPDLLWHITHCLDIGRGSIINKHCTKEAIPGITPTLIQQLLNLMNFLKIKE